MAASDDPRLPGTGDAPSGPGASAGVPSEDLAEVPQTGTTGSGTRTAHTWVALSAGLFFLIVILVFILENLRSVRVHFFWATWTIPLGVDLLLATVLGALIMFAVGSVRIVQLRRAARRAGEAYTARHRAAEAASPGR